MSKSPSQARCRALVRTWSLIRRLEGLRSGVTPVDLAQELGVTPRTIYRDLAAIEEAGFPLVQTGGKWHLFSWREVP